VWSLRVVVISPMLNDHLGFPQCVEDFTIEQFIAKLAVEGFAITVFPWAARCDVGGLRTDSL